ncbi:phosphatidylinositol-4-phosphate 5-kinase [Thraustotheca clavata]|uniref:Phosphatidylinositol-4-phosphate 5-kinase n=1 Tax=Thraustotheca clavata TaxID=74557 RepID=A0A1V9ZCA9_9STRA|nr:phosphatidylinositol-4-phosphate 5-kinase [Thraustotheca clavata]
MAAVYVPKEQIPIYEGKEDRGLRTGVGKLVFSNGDTYEGEFKNGYRCGKGVYTYQQGARVYDGEWKLSLRHGKGKETWRTKDISQYSYEGDYIRDKPYGYGIEQKKQVVYSGEFVNGLRDGSGRMVWPNGDSYDGHWREGRMSGMGKYTTKIISFISLNYLIRYIRGASGNSYEGNWVNGLRHGRGKEILTDEVYEGLWKEGLRHGEGMVIVNAHQRHGVWERGNRVKWTSPEKLIK